MLTETTSVSAITILEDGQLQIRRSHRVFDGAEMIAEQYHRHVLEPGQDLTAEDARVRRVATLLWTPAVITEYERQKALRRQP
mgnify:CR=1 FL=1